MRIVLAVAIACYPLMMYWLLEHVTNAALVGLFGLLIVLRLLLIPKLSRTALSLGLVALLGFCTIALFDAQLSALKLYPVLINLAAAGWASYTLIHPPSAIERLSRSMGMTIEGPAIPYTRRLTGVWLGFFIINAAIAAYTALAAPVSTWALYNGLISYVLIGLLLLGEYPVRRAYQRRHGAG